MALPIFRSYNQTLGNNIGGFLSKSGLSSLKIGGPLLSVFEAVSQSQLRNSADIFAVLTSRDLDTSEGSALDKIGLEEGVLRIGDGPSFGVVTITDSSFTKISTVIYQGLSAPIAGTTSLNVEDATSFPTSGNVYINRGGASFEGPLAYTSKTDNGSYWTLTLSSGTVRFHNTGESVVLAQGGNRTIPSGTIVQTETTSTIDSIRFRTITSVTIPDGENLIENIPITALIAGISGNVSAKSISSFDSNPFVGAIVTNPAPFTNATIRQKDEEYREVIRKARASKVKGTSLAALTAVIGRVAVDENRRIISASIVNEEIDSTFFIDDGTGYEEKDEGVALETLADLAIGGEQRFKLAEQPPITKAYLKTTEIAPFNLSSGQQLSFKVGNIESIHTFTSDQFKAINNANAYEVVASINSNFNLLWSARTSENATKVIVFGKTNENESIENVAIDNDANDSLGFPSGRVDTLRLYKNDILLNKDGSVASISSNSTSSWLSISGSQSLLMKVDGITLNFDTGILGKFTDQDFIDADTGFVTLGNNTAEAWAKVFNYRIPGITATVSAGIIVFTSNKGASSTASISIISGDLVTNGMFDVQESFGSNKDYTLNRNTGELKLLSPLEENDKLTAGSLYTRSFLQSEEINTETLSSDGELWFNFDGNAQIIETGLNNSTQFDITSTAEAWGFRIRVASSTADTLFSNVNIGDHVILWDPIFITQNIDGYYRVANKDIGNTWFEIERKTTATPGSNLNMTSGGFTVARTDGLLEKVTIPSAANYTATSFVNSLNDSLLGGLSSVYRTTTIRLNTNTFSDENGSLALLSANTQGQLLGLPQGSSIANTTGHLASVESSNSEVGTPDFRQAIIDSSTDSLHPTISWSSNSLYVDPFVFNSFVGGRMYDDNTANTDRRFDSNKGYYSFLETTTPNVSLEDLILRKAPPTDWIDGSRSHFSFPYMLHPDDTLGVLVDQDVDVKNFNIKMSRTLDPEGSTYALTNTYKDGDNGGASLVDAFGSSYDFNDFAVFMPARTKTHAATATKTALWRYFRLGPDGNFARLAYVLPPEEDLDVALTVEHEDQYTNIGIQLASGALSNIPDLATDNKVGLAALSTASGVTDIYYILGYSATSGTSDGSFTTITISKPAGIAGAHGILIGDVIYFENSGPFSDGVKIVTSITNNDIEYADTTSGVVAPTAITGTISPGTSKATLANASISVVPGMFFRLNGTQEPTREGAKETTLRIDTTGDQYIRGKIENYTGAISAVPLFSTLGAVSNFKVFENPTDTVSSIVSDVNALNGIISGTVIGAGSGTVDMASFEEAAASPTWFSLTDGINYVRTTTVSLGDYDLTFKLPIDSSLATDSDWDNETVKIVPVTSKNIKDWLNTLTITGLSSVATIERSSEARKIQIASQTAGADGSVEVQSSNANNKTFTVISSSELSGTDYMVTKIESEDSTGMFATQWVRIDNTKPLNKSVFDANTELNSITLASNLATFTFDSGATPVWVPISGTANLANSVWLIEKQDGFVVFQDTGLGAGAVDISTINEGDWVKIETPASPTLSADKIISQTNIGLYRIVRKSTPGLDGNAGAFWIENTNAIEQGVAEMDLKFLEPSSLMPGDIVNVGTNLWGINNKRNWTVVSVGDSGSGEYTDQFTFKVDASVNTPELIGSPVGPLGAESDSVQVIEGTLGRYFKNIVSIGINPDDNSLYDIKFDTKEEYSRIGAAAASIGTILDKLSFPLNIATGIDGYKHSTGLIAEANKVLYGDPTNTLVYPGVLAIRSMVNISGPLVKRITISLSVRIRSGTPTTIKNRIQSAVANYINKVPIGQSISLSDIISVVSSINGVVSVVISNPSFALGNDLIEVQENEKPLILNVDDDVFVDFIGS